MVKIKSKLIVISLFSAMFFLNCCEKSKEEKPLPAKSIENEIGIYHNKALELYYTQNRLSQVGKSYEDVRSSIISLLVNHEGEIFKEAEIKKAALKSEKILQGIPVGFSLKSTGAHKVSLSVMADYLAQEKKISKMFRDKLREINSKIENLEPSVKVLEEVNALRSQEWEEKDMKYLDAFVQVYNSSYDYWGERGRLKASGDGVIAADAAGALYGMILGPAWSIVEGAIFSVLANNY